MIDTNLLSGGRKPRHVPYPPHEGNIEGGDNDEKEGASGSATTDETQSYLDLFLDTCV
jgi:hypothetical protein